MLVKYGIFSTYINIIFRCVISLINDIISISLIIICINQLLSSYIDCIIICVSRSPFVQCMGLDKQTRLLATIGDELIFHLWGIINYLEWLI